MSINDRKKFCFLLCMIFLVCLMSSCKTVETSAVNDSSWKAAVEQAYDYLLSIGCTSDYLEGLPQNEIIYLFDKFRGSFVRFSEDITNYQINENVGFDEKNVSNRMALFAEYADESYRALTAVNVLFQFVWNKIPICTFDDELAFSCNSENLVISGEFQAISYGMDTVGREERVYQELESAAYVSADYIRFYLDIFSEEWGFSPNQLQQIVLVRLVPRDVRDYGNMKEIAASLKYGHRLLGGKFALGGLHLGREFNTLDMRYTCKLPENQ